jgi:hypothetical protein
VTADFSAATWPFRWVLEGGRDTQQARGLVGVSNIHEDVVLPGFEALL